MPGGPEAYAGFARMAEWEQRIAVLGEGRRIECSAQEAIDVAARRAISSSVKAENTALARKEAREKRNEKTRADAEIREAEDRFADAQAEIASIRRLIFFWPPGRRVRT